MAVKKDIPWHEVLPWVRRLHDMIRQAILDSRAAGEGDAWADVVEETAADTIFQIDKVTESAILNWMARNWPAAWPVELVMEGLEDRGTVTFPGNLDIAETRLKLIMDPIDGTRNLIYDKRPAWILSGVAEQNGDRTMLADLTLAVMTEIPTSKQWRADQLSAVRGEGSAGVTAEARNLFTGDVEPIRMRPSRAEDFDQGFAALARFFEPGKGLTAELEEALWRRVFADWPEQASPRVFEDQYISTGGQLYELIAGHDRMLVDLRPLVFRKLGLDIPLVCHPYDICTALIAEELGCVVEQPDGRPLDIPLDTTSAVAWAGYANPKLAALVRPVLRELITTMLGGTR